MIKFQLKTLKIALATLALCFVGLAQAQQNKESATSENYKAKVNDPTANFFDIVAEKRAEFANMNLSIKANNKAMKQFERWAYIWKDRINADGTFPSAENQLLSKNAYIGKLMETQEDINRTTTNSWTQIGPVDRPLENGYAGYPGKGRINVIAEDPNDSDIIYAGAAAGGVWKTTNNGALWSPKSDFLAGLGVTDILVDPTNTNIIYLATGDEDGEHVSSIGVFKSTDAGETWNPTGLTFSLEQNEYIRDLAFAPNSSTKIFALTNTEIRVTTNSGTSWTNVPVTYPFNPFTEKFQNIIFDPNDAMKVVVSDQFDAIYFSMDGGASFAIHNIYQGGDNQKKLKITSSANDPDYFYGISQDERNGENITVQAEFRKYRYAFTNTAADLISSTELTGFNSQGGYNQNIAVSPINKNNILVAGVNGFRSTNGGTTFSTLMNAYNEPPGAGFYVHADHHHLSFVGNTEVVLDGHDGGIHKGPFSATTATPWADISNTLVITQPYNIAVTQEANGDNFMMANQDNDGFSKILKDGTRSWVSAIAGDGTSTAIDIVNSNIRYLGGTNGQLYRADEGYANGYDQATYILATNSDAAFVSPMSVHPTNPNIIYACHGDIKKSTSKGGFGDPGDFSALGSGLIGTEFIDVTENGSSIRIYTIDQEGTAKRSDNDGATWTTVASPAGQLLNSFSAIPNSTIVYATVRGYSAGNKVYKSTDSGVTWTNISTGLPNIIIKKVVANRNSTDETLYIGTELGPYFKTATTSWVKIGTGLPNVRVDDLELNYTDNKLFIGTFGRGMWSISLENACSGITKTWDGNIWSPAGAPTDNDTVIIAGDYNTATNGGSLNVCALTISGTSTLTVIAGDYASVKNEVTVDANATLDIQNEGSFVQLSNDALVTNNGTINVRKTTPALGARSFMILSSPMSAETRTGAYGSFIQVRKYEPALFLPNPDVTAAFPDAINFADNNGDDWQLIPVGTATPLVAGLANLVIPQTTPLGTGVANINYTLGTLNNGTITAPIQFNSTQNGSSNMIGNPYASAIDVELLRNNIPANNAIFDVVYFWEHLTPPSTAYPGYNSANYSMSDISQYNVVSQVGLMASSGGPTPTKYIASGKGFGIKAKAGGTLTFNNAVRVVDNNTNYRDSEKELFYVNIKNATYNLGSTMAVNYTPFATNEFDEGYDTARLATPVSVYGQLETGQEVSIQSRGDFNIDDKVSIGFSTQISEEQKYNISINDISGDLLTNTPIYLFDTYKGTLTNLTESTTTGESASYEFLSNEGTFTDRFTLLFKNPFLGVDGNSLQSVGIIPNPTTGILNIIASQNPINNVTVFDVQGRIIREIKVNQLANYQIDLSTLQNAIYFVKVDTANGTITKKIIKQ